ncbi:MAG: tRNA (adenosine(37)-N6)-threonylcarbamoyltransferase complex ATPase subunit type 1 TsaE [Clostridiales bacterium]|nr:tRNA (adenosine(37)-N6)-threonylcarbamoyltransferase complex ATPase subunit type 1 TsaE [Clostridiales bacterium]
MIILDIISNSEQETEKIAYQFAKTLQGGECIALYGGLGVGKTAFVRGLAACLAPDSAVCSPSYAIVNEYGGPLQLCHFDMYRITDEDDLYSIGFYDYEGAVLAIEWSERIPYALPAHRYEVCLQKIDGEKEEEKSKRRITITKQ